MHAIYVIKPFIIPLHTMNQKLFDEKFIAKFLIFVAKTLQTWVVENPE